MGEDAVSGACAQQTTASFKGFKIIGQNHKQCLWCALLPSASRLRLDFICSQLRHTELINFPTGLFMIFLFFEVGSRTAIILL